MAENFEPRTQPEIHQEMLDSVRDDVDKREGSVVFDMTAPTSFQIEMLEYEILATYLNGFAATADLPYLIMRGEELGIEWKDAVKAEGELVISGTNGVEVPAGFRAYTSDYIYFETTEGVTIEGGTATAEAIAVEGGSNGNIGIDEIVGFINSVSGISEVTNEESFEGGVDAESLEAFRQRYFENVQTPATSGNKAHYLIWAKEVTGVGDAKVFPLWDGPGTVRIVIVGNDYRPVDSTIVEAVEDHIEDTRPIGAEVTVDSAQPVLIDVEADVSLIEGYEIEDIVEDFEYALDEYFMSISFSTTDEEEENQPVSYARIGSILLETPGVLDYFDLTVNGDTAHVTIPADSVAVVGDVVINN